MAEAVKAKLRGRTCVVTGANSGIGKAIARGLAGLGAEILLACRNHERGEEARREIAATAQEARLSVRRLDVASQASVRSFADGLLKDRPKIDVLVNCAGAWWLNRRESPDGIELQWATNLLGPHLLTQLLLPALTASGHGRIVNVASTAAGGLDLTDLQYQKRKYGGVKAYNATKQAQRMLTWALADRLKGTPVTANAMSPGFVKTGLNRNVKGPLAFVFKLMSPMQRTPVQGADTAVWLAASPEVEGKSGEFWVDRKSVPCKFRNSADQERLWKLCEGMLKKAPAAAVS
jgi:NAD(P)-dependent dehydrogenase (short-subunit alcohol dehydrogenase family)